MLQNVSLMVKRLKVKAKNKRPAFILEILPEYFLLGVFTVFKNWLGKKSQKIRQKPQQPLTLAIVR